MPGDYLHVCENEPGDNKQEAAVIVGHQEWRGGRDRKMLKKKKTEEGNADSLLLLPFLLLTYSLGQTS